MRNFVQKGRTVTLPAPYAVASGAGLLVGSIFGVANFAAVQGANVEADVVGVFDLPKTDAQAWTVGALIYWDDTNKVCTTVSSTNKLIGVALSAVANTAGLTTGRVRLNGYFAS
jgi:predicted RecA/RadA family phage recombinase